MISNGRLCWHGQFGLERRATARDLVAKEMTSDQIAEAQKMAREMVASNPKLMGE
ncbi:hypothetical protein F7C95_10515 [Opitutia bacterium ISCC 51]|nr:hypothetical protein F7C95_10515 [Opitutae bacterium ISCC 51]